MSKKKIIIITSTRADFGILYPLINLIKKDSFFKLDLIVTGTHLEQVYGNTQKEIFSRDIKRFHKIKINSNSSNSVNITKSLSILINKLGLLFHKIKPDILLLLGDRYEILLSATVANLYNIPIAHVHGGELTFGAIDDNFRHAITKLSHVHFVSTDTYKKRIIQLGENKKNIFNVGSLGVLNAKNIKLLNKKQIENKLNLKLNYQNTIIVTYHPTTAYQNHSEILELLNALEYFKDILIIFTMPNADPGSMLIYKQILKFVKKNKNGILIKSLGTQLYFSLLNYSRLMIGNSSSGIIEAPTLNVYNLNIGDRQKGRVRSFYTFDCKPDKNLIIKSILNLIKKKKRVKKIKKNPYFKKNTDKLIVEKLKKIDYEKIFLKKFNDL